jgi:lycopene beta-cyclase
MAKVYDIGVLGSGPAALSIAAAFAQRGASVALIAPAPDLPWQPTYCLWADELPSGMAHLAERVWERASVVTPLGRRGLDRPYLKLHTPAFQSFCWDAFLTETTRVVPGCATQLQGQGEQTCIQLDDGSTVRVRVPIDASGGNSPFVRRVSRREPAFQTAFGLTVRATNHGFDEREMILMDFRPAADDAAEPPSFLYVLPLGDDRVFLEETSLARRPAVRMDLLQSRLEARLASMGLQDAERLGEEHCSIPMGLGLPVPRQPVLSFGAAAAMVHPTSGYSIAHTLRKADAVAAAVLQGLDAGGTEAALAAGSETLWPRAQRAAWELYGFGLETLVNMKTLEMSRFFDVFFGLPSEAWSGFLTGTLAPAELGAVMTRLFCTLPASLQWHLIRSGLLKGAAPLARSALPRMIGEA